MKITNGKILFFTGVAHSLFGVTPFAFGTQFSGFASQFFFKISEGLFEFPLLNGAMNYADFAAFWFFYFGLLLIPLGILVHHIEKTSGDLPTAFTGSYLLLVLLGVYMIPFSGMTFFMLPHALYMFIGSRKQVVTS